MEKVNFENVKMEIHIDYKDGVKMTDFINYIDSINKGINDVNRKYGGLSNRSIGKFPSIITCIKPESIALDISLYVISTITLSIIANAIYD